MFLMHRVELKVFVFFSTIEAWAGYVPNAPCGVERYMEEAFKEIREELFLMHRVELKEMK